MGCCGDRYPFDLHNRYGSAKLLTPRVVSLGPMTLPGQHFCTGGIGPGSMRPGIEPVQEPVRRPDTDIFVVDPLNEPVSRTTSRKSPDSTPPSRRAVNTRIAY